MRVLIRALVLVGLLATLIPLSQPASAGTGAGSWSTTGSLHIARERHAAARLHDGRVLVAGGMTNTAELYDPATGVWSLTGALPNARNGAELTLLAGGRVLLTGGHRSSRETWLYAPAKGTWSFSGKLNHPRSNHLAVLLADGRVLVAGGNGPNAAWLTAAEVWDPLTKTWSLVDAMDVPRANATGVRLADGRVLVIGSGTASELFDPRTNTFSATGALAARRSYDSTNLTLLPDGRAVVAGNDGGSPGKPSTAEVYDPASGRWSPAGTLAAGRNHLPVVALADGSLLATGGYDRVSALASAERWDPATGVWRDAGAMTTARYHHTATLLADGRVLVVGGNGAGTSAELYTPADPPASGAGVSAPTHALVAPATAGPGVPVRVSWMPGDVVDVARFELQQFVDGAWQDVALSTPLETTVVAALAPDVPTQFRVRAIDGTGAASAWQHGAPLTPRVQQESSAALTWSGGWTEQGLAGAWGERVSAASTAGAEVTLAFSGTSVAWVSTTRSNRGSAEVWLDGTLVASVDLYRQPGQLRQVVFAAHDLAPGAHALLVRVTGGANALATGTRVDIDAFVVLE